MIFKDHKNRSNIATTLEYVFRASPSHGHKMDKVTFLQGSSMSASPLIKDQNGRVIDVDISELVKEFQFQSQLYKGSARNGKFYTHTSLSIQNTESLSDSQWEEVGNLFQEKLGFFFGETTFCFGLHHEGNPHIHIIANRVDNNGNLINQHNNWEKAQRACAEICKKFGLEIIPNSFDNILNENNDRTDRMKERIIREGDKTPPDEIKDVDVRAEIRRTIATVFKQDKPKTISDYANSLQKRGVIIKGVEGKIGECIGVKYTMPSLKDKYFAGSKISSSHASWGSILNPQRKGLDYNPMRDNQSLGLTGVRVRVKVTKTQVSTIKRLKLNVVVRSHRGQYYADLAFRSSNTDLLLEAIMEMIMKILATLFGGSFVDYYTPLELSQSKVVHDIGDNEKVYDGSDVQECMQSVDKDTACWLDEDSDPDDLDLDLEWDKPA
jgi:hypothetical protein